MPASGELVDFEAEGGEARLDVRSHHVHLLGEHLRVALEHHVELLPARGQLVHRVDACVPVQCTQYSDESSFSESRWWATENSTRTGAGDGAQLPVEEFDLRAGGTPALVALLLEGGVARVRIADLPHALRAHALHELGRFVQELVHRAHLAGHAAPERAHKRVEQRLDLSVDGHLQRQAVDRHAVHADLVGQLLGLLSYAQTRVRRFGSLVRARGTLLTNRCARNTVSTGRVGANLSA